MQTENKEQPDDQTTLTDEVRIYLEKRIQLLTLIVSEQISLIIAHSVQRLAGIFLLSTAVLFAWFALAFYIGELLENLSAGFLIASLPLFLAGFIFYNRRSKKLTAKIQKELVTQVMDSFESDEVSRRDAKAQ